MQNIINKQNGDQCLYQKRLDGLSELARHSRSHLYRFILRRVRNADDAEEITQQTFVEALKGIHHFRADAQLSTWVYAIAGNLVRNHLCRSPSLHYQWENDIVLESNIDYSVDPYPALAQLDLLRQLQSHLDALPKEMQETLALVAIDGMRYDEVAEVLNVPVGTVRSRMFRARAILLERLRTEEDQCLFRANDAITGECL